MIINASRIQELIRPNECIYKYGDCFVFYSVYFCVIFIWNEKLEKCEKIIFLDREVSSWLYVSCVKVGDCLYFVPYKARLMLRYHFKTETIERISVQKEKEEQLYHMAVHWCGKMYLFPVTGNRMLEYNLEKGTSTYEKFETVNDQEDIFHRVYASESRVWTITGKDTKIYCYDLEQKNCIIYKLKYKVNPIVDLTGEGEWLLLLFKDGMVMGWEMETGKETVILESNKEALLPFLKIHYCAGRIVLIPQNDDYIRIIDLNGQEICRWNFSNLRCANGRLFESSVMQAGIVIACTFKGNIIIVDVNHSKFRILDISFETAQIYGMLAHYKNDVSEDQTKGIGEHIWEMIQVD